MPIESQSFEALDLRLDEDVLTVRLNRADSLNAVNGQLHTDLARLFSALRCEPDIGAVVITGSGRAFCAGGDITWMRTSTAAELDLMFAEARTIVFDLVEIAPPVIAAVNGPAVGFGATLALLCDVVIAEPSAFLCDPHVSVGVVAGDGGAAVWPSLIGVNRAKEYLMTGDRLTAQEAERIGLVNRVAAEGESLAEAQALARRLSDGPREAIAGTKRAVNQILRRDLESAFEISLVLERESMASYEHREALEAFAEDRTPDFRSARHMGEGSDRAH